MARVKAGVHVNWWRVLYASAALLLVVGFMRTETGAAVLGLQTGFDEYGYNYNARVFQGKADGIDRSLDGTVWGDTTYANDRLVMKWSKEWDNARFNGASWTCGAWEDNEWNGRGKGGSGETWHYKIVWVGPELEDSGCWREGGYGIWGEFEVVMSQGSVATEHMWDVLTTPNGYGVYK